MSEPARMRRQLASVGELPLSAASGLVVRGSDLIVIGDDGWSLHVFDRGAALTRRVELPGRPVGVVAGRAAPKAVKADFEALALLPDGSLLVLGSGSRPNRRHGVRIASQFDHVTRVDLRPLYELLDTALPPLNIEGAAVHGEHLVLAQRATGAVAGALVCLDLVTVMRDLAAGVITGAALGSIVTLTLPQLAGLPLTLTDLAPHPDGTLWFSCTTEDTDDPYVDGMLRGSAIGRLNGALQPELLLELAPLCKIEGLARDAPLGRPGRWLLVADADDPMLPSPLYELRE